MAACVCIGTLLDNRGLPHPPFQSRAGDRTRDGARGSRARRRVPALGDDAAAGRQHGRADPGRSEPGPAGPDHRHARGNDDRGATPGRDVAARERAHGVVPRAVAAGARRRAPRAPRPGRSRRGRGFRDPPGHPAPPGPSRSRRPGLVPRRTRPALPAPAPRRGAGERQRSRALAARRRSRPRKDHRSRAHPESARARREGRTLPRGRAGCPDRPVAG